MILLTQKFSRRMLVTKQEYGFLKKIFDESRTRKPLSRINST